MKTEDRHRLIGELLRTREEVSVEELMAECGASGATIRRDLDVLSGYGVLMRIHGGARSLVAGGDHPGYGQRELEEHDAKLRIASAVSALLGDRQHVWLDSGSTATEIARKLAQRDLTVMPMSLRSVQVLAEPQVPAGPRLGSGPRLLLPGGSLFPGELSFRGPMAESNIRSLRFDAAVITPCAVSWKDGLLAHDIEDAAIKRAGIESAARVIAACSNSKWNASAVALVAEMRSVDVLVTDRDPDANERDQLERLSVEVVTV